MTVTQIGRRRTAARCETCAATYPWVGSIPCLLAESDEVLQRWSSELEQFVRQTGTTRDRLLAQVALDGVDAKARARVEAVRRALEAHQQRVLELFAAAGIEPSPASSDVAHRKAVPGEDKTESYYHQVHRDWGWDEAGSAEPSANLDAVMSAIDVGRMPSTMLVLGAGACRLPADLHNAIGAERTLALDINPLPFLIAQRVLAGDSVRMFEFPLSPRTSEDAAIERRLHAPEAVRDGFELIFGDGLDPPVPRGLFDTLLTPWFIDQVPKDLQDVIDLAARLLPVGGQWINHGPLLYHPEHTLFARRYRQDEVLERLARAGFEVEYSQWERMRYMESPSGSQGRTEGILTFRAVKTKNVRAAANEPDKTSLDLADPDAAVPQSSGLQSYEAPHPMFAAVVALIDGQRSARDIAAVLIEKNGLPPDAALGGVLTVLGEVFRQIDPTDE